MPELCSRQKMHNRRQALKNVGKVTRCPSMAAISAQEGSIHLA